MDRIASPSPYHRHLSTSRPVSPAFSSRPTTPYGEPLLDPDFDLVFDTDATEYSYQDDNDIYNLDDEDEDYQAYLINEPLIQAFLAQITAITRSAPPSSIPPADIKEYYIDTLTDISLNSLIFSTAAFTAPPPPKLTFRFVENGTDENGSLSCPCCLPDDLPSVTVDASDVDADGLITYSFALSRITEYLYGDVPPESPHITDDVRQGITGIHDYNYMRDGYDGGVMGLTIWLYLAKSEKVLELEVAKRKQKLQEEASAKQKQEDANAEDERQQNVEKKQESQGKEVDGVEGEADTKPIPTIVIEHEY